MISDTLTSFGSRPSFAKRSSNRLLAYGTARQLMRAGLTAAQYRPRRALCLAGRAEIAAIEMIESAIGGEEGEAALVACDDTGGAVVNFDDVGFGHGCSFADNVGAPVKCVISGFATGGSATGAGRRRDAAAGDAFAHIAHGWLWIQSHAVTLNTKNCIKYPVVRRIGQ
jgi:hypothetical protein